MIRTAFLRQTPQHRIGAALLMVLALAACQPGETEQPPAAEPVPEAPVPVEGADADAPSAGGPGVITAQGWGPLSAGMTLAEVIAAAGPDSQPNVAGGVEPEVCDEFRPTNAPEGLRVMIENGRLSRVSLSDESNLKTERGFGIGSTAAEIKAAYGGGVIVQPHKYVAAPAEDLFVWSRGGSTAYVNDPSARGVRYEIGADGKVMAIHAGGPSIQLVEGCS